MGTRLGGEGGKVAVYIWSLLVAQQVERKVMDSLLRSLHCIEPQLSAVDINSPRFYSTLCM